MINRIDSQVARLADAELPDLKYEIRVSVRARRLNLRVEAGRGLIVTIPQGVPGRLVPAFVARHRQWIEAQMAEAERLVPERFRHWPPRELFLPAVDLTLVLCFAGVSAADDYPEPVVTAGNQGRSLFIWLNAEQQSRAAVVDELTPALKRLARDYFPLRLKMLAEQHGLAFEKVQIRGQRTRWGSCSSRGTISLNYKLLFLSPALVDYVLRHELAHTRYLNHSPAFWRQLVSMQSDALEMDALLRRSACEVPPWLNLDSI